VDRLFPDETFNIMRILTLNVGLLDYNCCGVTCFSNPPYSKQRFPYLAADIATSNPDILAIQECYSVDHANELYDQLKHILPHRVRMDSQKWGILNLHNGMMILSKYPVQNSKLISHKNVACVEDWFGDKSTLVAVLNVPTYGPLHVINVHPTAGGADPESAKADANREITLREILDYYNHATNVLGHGAMIVGDLNCGPDVSPQNFSYIMDNGGLRDTFEEAVFDNKVPSDQRHSWDSRNLLNLTGPHAHTEPQRIDHILLSKNDSRFGKVTYAEIAFTEKKVTVPAKHPVTKEFPAQSSISDHYGVIVEVEVQTEGTVGAVTTASTSGDRSPLGSEVIDVAVR
jgi:endonuclease/exonuclease/phosphatase family metal-dependent hydrolase